MADRPVRVRLQRHLVVRQGTRPQRTRTRFVVDIVSAEKVACICLQTLITKSQSFKCSI